MLPWTQRRRSDVSGHFSSAASSAPPPRWQPCGAVDDAEAPGSRSVWLRSRAHPVAVHFKGSGFYSTDYGRGNRKPSRDGEKSDNAESGTKKEPEKKAPAAEAS